jgi:predicted unusual protein kinase regulating ubiquinone biosynthesis (AarF/ABC1/UbiB family)
MFSVTPSSVMGVTASAGSPPPPQGPKTVLTKQWEPYMKLGKFGTRLAAGALVSASSTANDRRRRAVWIRDELVRLGPAYIKIGQVVSTRKDIFSDDITSVLETLQDDVDVIDFAQMEAVFQDAFGESTSSYFRSIDPKPIASASIAQVYAATMRNGANVVVKIQKPGLNDAVLEDLEVIRNTLAMLRALQIKVVTDLSLIVNECSNNLLTELDFRNETRNIQVFRRVFESFDNLRIPRVYAKATKSRVMIMEYLPGTKLNAIRGRSGSSESLANEVMTAFLKGLLQYGYVHADPHGGNMAVAEDGRLILYDFGLVASYDRKMMESFRTMAKAFMLHQTNELIDCVLENEIVYMYQTTDARSHKDLTPSEYVVMYNLTQYLFEYSKTTDVDAIASRTRTDPYINASNLPFYFNSKMILLFKTFTTLEGVCKELNPDFSYTELYAAIIRDIVDVDFISAKIMADIDTVTRANDNSRKDEVQSAKMSVMNERYQKQTRVMYAMIVVTLLELML